MGDFLGRLRPAVERTGPLCVGIDPSPALLVAWGVGDDAAGLSEVGLRCVEALAGVVPIVKPQVAFFERHGSAGLAALETVTAAARSAGLLVLADAKRGDIASTAAAYADAWLGETSPLAADAVTATPYLGLEALSPLFDQAAKTGRAVFVVVRSSNPEGWPLQQATTAHGEAVEDALLADIARLNRARYAGAVGAVVGVAPGRRRPRTPLAQVGGPLLGPGVGAQGATAADVASLFAGCADVLASVSRSVLGRGPDPADLRRAAVAARDEMRVAVRDLGEPEALWS